MYYCQINPLIYSRHQAVDHLNLMEKCHYIIVCPVNHQKKSSCTNLHQVLMMKHQETETLTMLKLLKQKMIIVVCPVNHQKKNNYKNLHQALMMKRQENAYLTMLKLLKQQMFIPLSTHCQSPHQSNHCQINKNLL
ncbi:unnamed protein product [Meganyctiphanes norvegica]|uniref:Uncharacterized protein n=1 Tax=Meganyctiphanes norvegica TaxID=48144 RepID=A0AAV2RBU7_MEGNR